jgi:hypothetical protein
MLGYLSLDVVGIARHPIYRCTSDVSYDPAADYTDSPGREGLTLTHGMVQGVENQ